jgi:hypothetical protein
VPSDSGDAYVLIGVGVAYVPFVLSSDCSGQNPRPQTPFYPRPARNFGR